MRVYEVLFIVAPNVEEGDIEGLVTQFSDIATNQGAQVTKVDRMGRRRLAYPIGKFAEIERRMRVSDAVIRYITIRIDEDLKRAEKFGVRRAARAAAGRGRNRGRKSEPVLPIGSDDDSDEEDED